MNRNHTGRIVAGVAAAGFITTAAWHATGYTTVTRLAEQAPDDLRPLIPALWLAISIDLTIAGLIVAIVAVRPTPVGRIIVAIAAMMPLAIAGLQMAYLGFIPPTVLLLLDGALALAAAATLTGGDGPAP